MSSRAMIRVGLLLLGISAGLVSLPADLTGQDPTVQPPRTISVWIEEARASPFHGLIPVGTPENPSVESAVGASGAPRHGPAPVTWLPRPIVSASQIPDTAISTKRLFGYTLLAATIPMIPGMILAGSALWGDPPSFERRGGQAQGAMVIGAIATLVTVPAAAMIAGADSLRRARVGTVTGFVAGSLLGGVALSALSDGEFWIAPVFSLTMGSVTTLIVAGRGSGRGA